MLAGALKDTQSSQGRTSVIFCWNPEQRKYRPLPIFAHRHCGPAATVAHNRLHTAIPSKVLKNTEIWERAFLKNAQMILTHNQGWKPVLYFTAGLVISKLSFASELPG